MATRTQNTLHSVELDLHPNEASDLLPVENERLLAAHGWDRGFWTVLDEGTVERSVALIGHRDGAGDTVEDWETTRPRFRVPCHEGESEDGEACARHDGWIYVVGSHYGKKGGPLETKRAFLARFREDDFDARVEASEATLDIAMDKLRLHRAVNDALRAFGPELLGPGPTVQKSFIAQAPRGAGKQTARRVRATDAPLNIEGAAFTAKGNLLLALRYPVTASGHPIIAELAGVPQMFEQPAAAPVVRRFWTLEGVGSEDEPLGFRALHRDGDDLNAIVGSLDASGKGSALLEDHPQGAGSLCAHVRLRLPPRRDGGPVETEIVHRFDVPNVEGLARDRDGRIFYITDEDNRVRIHLMSTDA